MDSAEIKAGLPKHASTDARHADRQERAAKEAHPARAACLCTLTVSRAPPRRHSLPSTCGEKPAGNPNRPAKAVTGATRRWGEFIELREMNLVADRRHSFNHSFHSVRISARAGAACCVVTSAFRPFGGSTASRFAVGPAGRPTGGARTRALVITVPPTERRASTCPGRARASACG